MNIKIISIILLSALLLLSSCGEGSTIEEQPPVSGPERPEQTEDALTYEEFWELDGDAQLAYKESFESVEAFYAWYNAAKSEYDAAHPGIDAGDGNIDLGELAK